LAGTLFDLAMSDPAHSIPENLPRMKSFPAKFSARLAGGATWSRMAPTPSARPGESFASGGVKDSGHDPALSKFVGCQPSEIAAACLLSPMKFLRTLAALPLFTVGLWAADSVGHGITTPESMFPQLETILSQAVAQSPTMLARSIDQEIAENDRKVARSGLLPSVGGYYRYWWAQDKRSDRPDMDRVETDKQFYDLSINQPVFHWGERKNNDKIGAIRLALAGQNYREAYRVLADTIRTSYFRLINDKLRVTRTEFANAHLQDVAKRSEDRLAKKEISDAQAFLVRTEAERSQITTERTRLEFEFAKQSFARLTGLPQLTDDQIPDDIPAVQDQSAAVQAALADFLSQDKPRTAVALNNQNLLEIERKNLAIAKTRLLPKINMQAGINQDEQTYGLTLASRYSVNSLYYGVSVNWTIFDGFASSAAQRSAYARIRQLERDYRTLTEQLASTAQHQAKMTDIFLRYAKINDGLVPSSEGNLATKRDDFKRGINSEDDVAAAQLNVYDTKLLAFASRQDYYNTLVDFLGTIAEDPVLKNIPAK
jgi:outer membrane protein TolC